MSTDDSLSLGQNTFCQRMLSHYGDNHPQKECVVLSSRIIKINKKGKEQKRILLLTDKALYNLKGNKIYTCQRRIAYNIIESISTSVLSTEFTIHVPSEYDYRYKAANACNKHGILAILSQLCNVNVHKIDCFNTENITITKKEAKILSIDARRKQIKQITPPTSRTDLVGPFYTHLTMSELNQKIKTPKTKLITEITETETVTTPSSTGTIWSSFGDLRIESYDLFGEYNIDFDTVLKRINIKDEILVYGYIRKKAILKYKLQIDSDIIDYCLLYACAMLDAFDINNDMIEGDDFVKVSDDKKVLTVGKNDILDQIVYGLYNVDCKRYNNLKTFMWKLRIKQITYDSIIYIGIGNDIQQSMVYKAGGYDDTFNICKNDQNIGKMLHGYERGDYIDIILDLVDNMLIFLINCGTKHVIKNIMIDNNEYYKLSVLLSKACVVLKDFIIFDGSWDEYQKSENIHIKYNTKYFC